MSASEERKAYEREARKAIRLATRRAEEAERERDYAISQHEGLHAKYVAAESALVSMKKVLEAAHGYIAHLHRDADDHFTEDGEPYHDNCDTCRERRLLRLIEAALAASSREPDMRTEEEKALARLAYRSAPWPPGESDTQEWPEGGLPHGEHPYDYHGVSVPCGHPLDPVAFKVSAGWVCHCGRSLNDVTPISDGKKEGAPGPIVPCDKCGCHVALPAEEPDDG